MRACWARAEPAVRAETAPLRPAGVGYRGGGGTGGIGGWLYGNAGSAGSAGSGPVNGTVPLGIFNTTEPLVYISVNGGPQMPVLVDTGSAGLVVPIQDIGLQQLGLPRGFGISGYSGGLTYIYATFHTSVNFGNGIVTPPTDVNVVLLSFPQTLQGYFSTAGVQGVLGVGPNATGPGPSIPNTTLPDGMGQGVLIDEPHNQLTFGPNPLGARSHGCRITDHHPGRKDRQRVYQLRSLDCRLRWRVRNHAVIHRRGRLAQRHTDFHLRPAAVRPVFVHNERDRHPDAHLLGPDEYRVSALSPRNRCTSVTPPAGRQRSIRRDFVRPGRYLSLLAANVAAWLVIPDVMYETCARMSPPPEQIGSPGAHRLMDLGA